VTEWRPLLQEKVSGAEVVLGVRPEDISILGKEKPNGITGEVYVLEPLGSELIVSIKVNETMIKVKCASSMRFVPGSRVSLSFDSKRIHIFDKKTGTTLV
jgi:multiple sugar transport system ATP-binding protein